MIGADVLREMAAKAMPPSARVLTIDADPLAQLRAHAHDADAILAPCPSRAAPLMPFLEAARQALLPASSPSLALAPALAPALFVCDIVWQTAPTPELLSAFAPAPGRDKVRPIEGYEMQIEHAGFEIDERLAIDRARWVPGLAPDTRAAVEADARGAAKLAAWRARAT